MRVYMLILVIFLPRGQSSDLSLPRGQSLDLSLSRGQSSDLSSPRGQSSDVPLPRGQSADHSLPGGQSSDLCPLPDREDEVAGDLNVKVTGCETVTVAEKIETPVLVPRPHEVVEIQPSIVYVSRCVGLCSSVYRYQCNPLNITIRSVQVLAKYNNGYCVESTVKVREDYDCTCGCINSTCEGNLRRDPDTCICRCPGQIEECSLGKEYNSESCGCVCKNREESTRCMWRHIWNSDLCACQLNLSSTDHLYICIISLSASLFILTVCLLKLIHLNKKLHNKIDENTTYGMSKRLLREYVKIKPLQKSTGGWEYVNTY